MTNSSKFYIIDKEAAQQIARSRVLQSIEYTQGAALANSLRSGDFSLFQDPSVSVIHHVDGCYFLTSKSSNNFLVFDFTNFNPFTSHSDADGLLIFQKVLRLAVKVWSSMRLGQHEYTSDNKLVIFPFPFAEKTSYRIIIERANPKSRRTDTDFQNCLLAFRDVTEGDGLVYESPTLAVFQEAIEGVSSVRGEIARQQHAALTKSQSSIMSFVDLKEDIKTLTLSPFMSFEHWIHYLTTSQRSFVTTLVTGPERIEGPAGTGKTLCLILKCINQLKHAKKQNEVHHALFICHSMATQKSAMQLFEAIDSHGFYRGNKHVSAQSVRITTLHEWCIELLGNEISLSETEYIDPDAMDSKELQLLLIQDAVEEARQATVATYRPFFSERFRLLFDGEDPWSVAEMIRHEIAVTIKGRANEDLESYKRLERPIYTLPLTTEGDLGFVFSIFNRYKEKLMTANQFDTDDIVISAMGPLNTPIWRRRRVQDGFDSIFIDETHLFNVNELSIFHYLTKRTTHCPIVFSIDRSQAIGDRGFSNTTISEQVLPGQSDESSSTKVRSVFRCSPDIVALALSVTASGATLFTNFENPLQSASSMFTEEEIAKCAKPRYFEYPRDEAMIEGAFANAQKMTDDMQCEKSDIAIIAFSSDLLKELEKYGKNKHKPFEILRCRGDIEIVSRAKRSHRFVLAAPDYVGGLEFSGIILVGVDKGRVPPTGQTSTTDSRHFLEFASHNRLYVAITRAKYRIEIMGDSSRDPSGILNTAFERKLIER